MQKLTALAVKQAKAKDKNYSLADGGGLYLLVKAQGKYWRYNYRFGGKQKTLAIGVYPDKSLAGARLSHQSAREKLNNGIDPSEIRKVEKITKNLTASDLFDCVAREWFNQKILDKSASHQARTLRILEKDLFPVIGSRPASNITALELTAVLHKIQTRSVDIAQRAKQVASAVFRYAVRTGRAEFDPARDLAGALRSRSQKHYPSITQPEEVGHLLIAVDGYKGTAVVKAALQLSILLFQRPGEIRHMEWSEISWEKHLWEIPDTKMKMKQEHIVPLSTQAMSALSEIRGLTGRGRYVLPSARGGARPLSENGVRTALRTLGYNNETITPHGFRAMARTLLDEVLNFPVDWIEHQLAHAVKDPNGRAYNRTKHLAQRHVMMQGWADYLDELRTGKN
jgi:integrase